MTSDENSQLSENSGAWLYNNAPALVAHRGFARLYPENTLTSIAAAVDAGARFVEFDIQLSKDGVPFLMHDADFKRTAGLKHSVFALNMSEIRTISVGEQSRLGGRFHDVKPITLEELCSHLNDWPNVHSFVEVKQQSIDAFGLEKTMTQIMSSLSSLKSPHTIISFSADVLDFLDQRHKTQAGAERNYTTGWVFDQWTTENFNTLKRLSPEFVYSNYKKIPDGMLIPQGSWTWVLYEVTDPDIAQYWRQRGIHMIETMAVSSMLSSSVFTPSSASSNTEHKRE